MVATACNFGLRGVSGAGSLLPWRGVVSLSKALHLYMHLLNPGMNRYLVGQ